LLVLILFLTLGALFIFMLGRVVYRKREVVEVYKKISPLLQKRNEQIAHQLSNKVFDVSSPVLLSVQKMLDQAAEEDLDMFETIAIENKMIQYFDNSFLNQLSENENTQALYKTIINSNINLIEARDTFNMTATYHNYSVEYFPTKIFSKILGYQTVPQIAYPFHTLAESASAE